MTRIHRIALAAALAAGLGTGCAQHSHVDDHWGESYRTLTAQQIENPDAGNDPKPVEGMNSTTAPDVTATYHSRQAEQSKPPENRSVLVTLGNGD